MFKPHINQMSPYTPPLEGRSQSGCLLLDFNESVVSPPSQVSDALSSFIHSNRLQVYPEYGNLTELIGNYAQVPPGSCLFTNGSDQAIDILMRLVVNPGDNVLLLSPSFAMFEQAAQLEAAQIHEISYNPDFSFPYAEFEKNLGATNIRLAVIVNPNNPTGTPVDSDFIQAMVSRFPDTFFIVDEAYYEFHRETSSSLIAEHRNVAVLRTFSKAFALAALRVGYLLGHSSLITELEKVRGPYDVNMLGAVGAMAALKDPSYVSRYADEVMNQAKPMLIAYLQSKGVDVYAGRANFLLLHSSDPPSTMDSLRQQGILVRRGRKVASSMVRITVGPVSCVEKCIEALEKCL
ncbi:pyridoxal phosphate-dependent aminotransferase [Desulfurispira natronophila]|nr:histidinol-phosphate transaminase [Desulfurispira natronophila]